MGNCETCVIWGDGPETRRSLGAGTPCSSESPLQGTAASAAVPIPAWRARRRTVGLRLALLLVLFALEGATRTHAQGGPDAARDGFPSPPGEPHVDAASGTARVVFPIDVPPGRHGMQPALGLRYSSAGGPGNAGYGFTLDTGSIERDTLHGPPRFDNSDTFRMTLNGETYELFPLDAGSTRFRTVIDTGFLIARLSPGPYGPGSTYWMARGRDGRAYRFGFNGDAASGNCSQVDNFKWGLDRVEDTAGNVLEIRYQAAGQRLYPLRIEYASHPATGLSATNMVQICWERRGDEAPTASREMFLYRLSSILTSASGKPARSYSFTYNLPADSSTTLGQCAVPTLPLPPPGSSDPGGPTGPPPPGSGRPGGPRISSISFGRDGPRAPATGDVAVTSSTSAALSSGPSLLLSISREDGTGQHLPPINYGYGGAAGAGYWPSPIPGGTPPLPFVYSSSGSDEDPGVRVCDLNRDGLPDLIQFAAQLAGSVYSVTKAVYLNNGIGFLYDASWTASLTNLIDTTDQSRSAYFVLKRSTRDRVEMGVRFLDVNDDGYPDIVRIASHFGLGLRKGVFLNTGSGFTTDRSATFPLPDEPFVSLQAESSGDFSQDLGVRIADANGDGRADLLVSRAEWGASATRRVYLYDHGSYRLDSAWVLPDDPFVRHVPHGRYLDMGMRLMELNGDGLVDLFRASNVDGMVQNLAYLNTGRPGGPSSTWTLSGADWWLQQILPERFVDVSSAGDGVSLDRGLRVVNENGLSTSYLILARRWDGTETRTAYYPIPTGGWGRNDLPQFPGLFVVKPAGGAPRDQGVRMIDVDGDGGLDFLASPETGTREWRRNTIWRSSLLLATYSNGIGGRTTLLYAPAPHSGTVEGGQPASLPYPLPVVQQREVDDGMGHVYVTRYAYDSPFHHHAGREFRGFRRVTVTPPGGAQSIETVFFQQPSLPAAPLRGVAQESIARRTVDGAVFSRTSWDYDTGDNVPPVAHPLRREETELFDWSTTDPDTGTPVKRTAVSYSYVFDETTHPPDRMMIVRTERREGSLDDPADDRITSEEFTSALDDAAASGPAQGRWFLDLPMHRVSSGVDARIVSESWTFYDGLPLRGVGLKGLATREQRRGGAIGSGPRSPLDAIDPATTRGFDPYGNLAWEVDPLGHRRVVSRGLVDKTFTYPDSETDALGRVTSSVFDPRTGLLTSLTDPNGAVTRLFYDGFGRRTAECGPYDSPEFPTVAYVHDYFSVPARVFRFARERSGSGEKSGTNGMTESIAFFDGLGRLLQTKVEAQGGRMIAGTAVTFDVSGRIATEAEPFFADGEDYSPPGPGLRVTRRTYDPASRLVAITDLAGQEHRREYAAWSTTFLDPLLHRRDQHRNAFGGIVRVEDFEGSPGSWRAASIAGYAYDAAGRLTSLTDPMGAVTRITYDALGRRIALDDPHAGAWRYTYDLGGNLTVETDPLSRITIMTYDALDRLLEKDLPGGTRHLWGYDEGGAAARAIGRLTSIADPTGVERFEHDLLGRIVKTSRTLAGVLYEVSTEYDAQGRILGEILPGGPPASFDYDEGGNLASALPFAPAISHNLRGQVTEVVFSTGLRTLTDYDDATGRPVRQRAIGSGGQILLDDGYAYLADGQLARMDDRHEPQVPRAQTYTYDGRHRLTRAVGPYGDLSFSYDDAGNLTMKEGIGFFYDDPTHPQWLTRTSAGQSFSYDPAGNTLNLRSAASNRYMMYDPSGRMLRLTDELTGLVVDSDYDADGRRVREAIAAPGRPNTVLLTPMPQIEIRDGVVTLHYFASGRRLAMLQAGNRVLIPITDTLGSTRLVVDSADHVLVRYDYRPYGQALVDTEDPSVTHTFASALVNRTSGLLLMGARQYDPALGRFLQADAVVADPATPLGLHRYAYAWDDPVNLSDPHGRNPILGLVLFAGAIALLDHDTRQDVVTSVALTAISIYLTAVVGPGGSIAWESLMASKPALYAAAVTPIIMHTPLGTGIVESYSALFQDLGMSPRSSAIAGSIFSTFLLNSSFQRGFANAMADHGEIRSGQAIDGEDALRQDALENSGTTDLGSSTGDIYGMPIQGYWKNGEWKEPQAIYQLVDSGHVVGAYGTRELGLSFEHGTAAFYGHGPTVTQSHGLYLLGGVSTQQFARELFHAGYSGTLFTLTGRTSDFLVEFIYGPYGGGLALGVQAGREASSASARPDP